LPSIHRLHGKLKGTGLRILLIDIQEAPSTVAATAKQRGYTLPVLLDQHGAVTQAYGVRGTPTVTLIDSSGFVRGVAVGPRDWDSPAGLRVLQSLRRSDANRAGK